MVLVLSGMNWGALVAPFVAGAIYDHAEYHAVWGVCLGVAGFDFILRLTIIEKIRARKWQDPRATDTRGILSSPAVTENAETDPLLPDGSESETSGNLTFSQGFAAAYDTSSTNDSDLPEAGLP